MGRLFLILLLSSHSLISCSQSRYSIRKINAFLMVKMPGNIPVDENGKSLFNGPDTLITIYIEISGKEPEWKTAWYNNSSYAVSSSLISQTTYEAGTKKTDGKKVILKPAAGNKLWQLILQRDNDKIKIPQKIRSGEILLSGKYRDKNFLYKINSLFQLTTPPSV
jgi:hypothetical protein